MPRILLIDLPNSGRPFGYIIDSATAPDEIEEVLTPMTMARRLRLTIGLNPVSFGKTLTKENPNARLSNTSSASSYTPFNQFRVAEREEETYGRESLELFTSEILEEGFANQVPVILSKEQRAVPIGR